MTDAEIATIGKLADLCRSKGIRLIDLPGSVRLELDEVWRPSGEKMSIAQALKAPEADECKCGHPLHAHMGGLCVLGCEVEKCEPPGKEA